MTPESRNNRARRNCPLCDNGWVNTFPRTTDTHAAVKELLETVFYTVRAGPKMTVVASASSNLTDRPTDRQYIEKRSNKVCASSFKRRPHL
jgi:hypothetical protein